MIALEQRRFTVIIISATLVAVIIGGWYLTQPDQSSSTDQPTEITDQPTESKDLGTTGEAPTISLLKPEAKENLTGTVSIIWSASDPDGDLLNMSIMYTTDPAPYCTTCPPQRWHTITAIEENDGSFDWDTTKYPSGLEYQIKILASDGEHTSEAVSGSFIINN